MAFFYVKSGGARTTGGGDPTARTGTWNASSGSYYNDLVACFADSSSPTAGDFVLVSDASQQLFGADHDPDVPDGVHILTVSDSNQDQYSPATAYQFGNPSGFHTVIVGTNTSANSRLLMGVHIQSGDSWGNLQLVGYSSTLIAHDFSMDFVSGAAETHDIVESYGAAALFDNLNVDSPSGNATQDLVVQGGGHVTLLGGSFSNIDEIFDVGIRSADIRCYGVDFSACPSGTALVQHNTSPDGWVQAYLYRCNLPLNWTTSNEDVTSNTVTIVESCDSEYQYEVYARAGVASFVVSRYHDDDPVLSDAVNKGSYELTGNANCSPTEPLFISHTYAPRWLMAENTGAPTNNKVRIKFASDSALDSASLWVYVCYPTNANPTVWTSVRHQISPIESGTALPTESGKWVGANTTNQYYLDTTMPAPGNGLVAVMVGSTEASTTIYLSPVIEFVP